MGEKKRYIPWVIFSSLLSVPLSPLLLFWMCLSPLLLESLVFFQDNLLLSSLGTSVSSSLEMPVSISLSSHCLVMPVFYRSAVALR